jgi:hypothetical protein
MRDLVRSSGAACLLLMALCPAAVAQRGSMPGDESARILSLENIWNQAEVKHDARALNLLLAEPFEYTDSDGSFMNRSEWLTHVGSGVDRYEQLSNSGMVVHIYGDVAIVTGGYLEKLTLKEKSAAHSGRFTDTWIQRNGEWKCVASQSTLISP